MILNDSALWLAAQKGLVTPFLSGNLQGSSIDLTLGNEIKIENARTNGDLWTSRTIDEKGYVVMPGQFILAHTAETVQIPNNCAAMLLLRSSAARAGFEHSFSGWCDPGFVGQLTLELRNNLQHRPLWIAPGLRICQLVVHRLTEDAQSTYERRGHYQNQVGATPSTNNFAKEAL